MKNRLPAVRRCLCAALILALALPGLSAAARVTDENRLPRHSAAYREAYAPAYRVIHRDFAAFGREEA